MHLLKVSNSHIFEAYDKAWKNYITIEESFIPHLHRQLHYAKVSKVQLRQTKRMHTQYCRI